MTFFTSEGAVSQKFKFPQMVIDFVVQHANNKCFWQKLVKTCKYVFIKNPVIIVADLIVKGDEKIFVTNGRKKFKVEKPSSSPLKFWLTEDLTVDNDGFADSYLRLIYKSEVSYLFLFKTAIQISQLKAIGSMVKSFSCIESWMLEGNNVIESLHQLWEALPNLQAVSFTSVHTFGENVSSSFISLPSIKNFSYIKLSGLDEDFDFAEFGSFMKNNDHISFLLRFHESITEGYVAEIETFIKNLHRSIKNGAKRPQIILQVPKMVHNRYIWHEHDTTEDFNASDSTYSPSDEDSDAEMSDD